MGRATAEKSRFYRELIDEITDEYLAGANSRELMRKYHCNWYTLRSLIVENLHVRSENRRKTQTKQEK